MLTKAQRNRQAEIRQTLLKLLPDLQPAMQAPVNAELLVALLNAAGRFASEVSVTASSRAKAKTARNKRALAHKHVASGADWHIDDVDLH